MPPLKGEGNRRRRWRGAIAEYLKRKKNAAGKIPESGLPAAI